MTRLKVGFIGCGRHATKTLFPSLRYAPVALEAVCDLDGRLARRNARWFGASEHFTDYRDMLACCQLDAVVVVVGPQGHAPIAEAVIAAGVPVLIEKPPALTLAEAEALARSAERTGRAVTVGMMKRHAPCYARVKSIIDEPGFGPVSHVQAAFRIGRKVSSGFALLLDAGIHVLDLVRFLGGELRSVRAEHWEATDGNGYAVLLRYESGAVGTVHVSDQGSFVAANEFVEVTGAGEYVRSENLIRVQRTVGDGTMTSWEPGLSIPSNLNNSLFVQGYAPMLQHWAASLLRGAEPTPSIADVCETMRVIRTLEPDERYEKRPVDFAHWVAEDTWLQVDAPDA